MLKNPLKILTALALMIFIAGCNYSSQIVDDIIIANNKEIVKHTNAVQKVVGSYFLVAEDLEVALSKLEDEGFQIVEFSMEGNKDFPDGKFRAYSREPDITERIISEFGRNYKYKYVSKRYQTVGFFSNAVETVIESDVNGIKVKHVKATVVDS